MPPETQSQVPAKKDASRMPALRFPQFSGEWEARRLGEMSDVRDGTHDSPKYHDYGYPLVTSKNLRSNGVIDFSDVSLISEEDFNQINKRSGVHEGDILFGMIGTIGNPVFVKECGFSIKNVALIKENEVLKNNYLYQYLRSGYIDRQFYKNNAGGTQKFIALGAIRSLRFHIPSKEEQQKIAEFLGSVDEKIEQLSHKKKSLEKYKKGVMQKLFLSCHSREGGNPGNPELRFKDENGNSYPDWEKKKLGYLCDIKTGKKDVNEGNPNGKYPFFTCAKTNTYSDEYSFDGDAILIAGNGEVGNCQLYSGKFEAYQRTYVLNNFLIDVRYLFLFLGHFFQKFVSAQKQMGAMPYIKLGMLTNFIIIMPSFGEQQKIAGFLTSIDEKISAMTSEITQAKEFKKGLLQQMFV